MNGEMAEQDVDDTDDTINDFDDSFYCECPIIHDMEESDTGICSCCGKFIDSMESE